MPRQRKGSVRPVKSRVYIFCEGKNRAQLYSGVHKDVLSGLRAVKRCRKAGNPTGYR